MSTYRLYYFQPRSHGLVRFADFDAPSDEEAQQLALEEKGQLALELWREHHKLVEIEATDIASRVTAKRRQASSHEPGPHHETRA